MRLLKTPFLKTLLTTSLFSTAAFAEVVLENKAFKVTEVKTADGKTVEQWKDPDKMLPGDKVGYQIHFRNTATDNADGIVISNPVPENTEYVADSAKGSETAITFSVDNGNNFAQPAQLFVEKNGKRVQATAADYTNVRWQLTKPLAAGASGSVQYIVVIK